jgi:hypothetical protein
VTQESVAEPAGASERTIAVEIDVERKNAQAAFVLRIKKRWHWRHYPPVRFVVPARSDSEFPYWRHVMDAR